MAGINTASLEFKTMLELAESGWIVENIGRPEPRHRDMAIWLDKTYGTMYSPRSNPHGDWYGAILDTGTPMTMGHLGCFIAFKSEDQRLWFKLRWS